jgi:integrase
MVLLDAATGLRRSELLALKWEDVDFERWQINVRRSI